jgi:DNA-binding response OmpR family regulator
MTEHTLDKKILIIEDDPPTARMMKLMLATESFDLSFTPNRHDALPLVETLKPDLIVMDYLTGGPSAEEFIENVRAVGFEGPIMLCTAMTGVSLPVDDILVKPFDPFELPRRLNALLV